MVRSGAAIRGTRPFWSWHRKQLNAFAPILGIPGAFITLSPADLHWQSLYRHMPEYDVWKEADDQQRMKMSARLLRENPHIAAWHFHLRNTAFREIILKKKFGLTDYWSRYEWQGRGSSYSHGLFWFRDAPEVDLTKPDERQKWARSWGCYLSAMNPNRAVGADQGDPLFVVAAETPVTWGWLNRIVNRCQKHKCNSTYCLRVSKKARKEWNDNYRAAKQAAADAGEPEPAKPPEPKPECRFFFPKAERAEADLVKFEGRKAWTFDPARNDTHLNQYNPLVSLCWLANTDISPCCDHQAVSNYASKYCSKAETQSATYAELSRMILPYVSDRNPMLSYVSKLLNKLIGERDISAQECCYMLLNLPL